LAACVEGEYVYTSTDSGTTWLQHSSVPITNWVGIASSSDGNKIILSSYGASGYLYTSSPITSNMYLDIGQVYQLYSSGTQQAQNIIIPRNTITTYAGTSWTIQLEITSQLPKSIACSGDGIKVAACCNNSGYIYTSTNSGITWLQRTNAGARNWISIASSSDGKNLVAVVNGGYVYTSTDSGNTWTENTNMGSLNWYMVKSSNDGKKLCGLVVIGSFKYIYTSTNSGVNWIQQTTGIENSGGQPFTSIASSSDGNTIIAANNIQFVGYITLSINSGVTWSTVNVLSNEPNTGNIYIVASSIDGKILIASSTHSLYIYISSDSGTTWVKNTSAGARIWTNIAVSDDGNIIIASVGKQDGTVAGLTYISTDYGATWSAGSVSDYWTSLAMSSDGKQMFATVGNTGNTSGTLYTSFATTSSTTYSDIGTVFQK
jgi:hypothetical protein